MKFHLAFNCCNEEPWVYTIVSAMFKQLYFGCNRLLCSRSRNVIILVELKEKGYGNKVMLSGKHTASQTGLNCADLGTVLSP